MEDLAKQTSSSSMEHALHRLHKRIDEVSAQNMQVANFWDRIFPNKIQRAVYNATTELIDEQARGRREALRLTQDAQLASLKLTLDDGLARLAIEKKATGMIYLTNRRQEAEAELNASVKKAAAELEIRLEEANTISSEIIREIRVEALIQAFEKFIDLTSIQVTALDKIIQDYSQT